MPRKLPSWTRKRIGKDRVHWVAYEGSAEGEPRQVVDQGYAASLTEADAAARAALAGAGLFGGRRQSTGLGRAGAQGQEGPRKVARPAPSRPKEYLYSRREGDPEDGPLIAAHMVLKKTAARVHVSARACGPDQIGTEDEVWEPIGRGIAVDRARLERDGSATAGPGRSLTFYKTLGAARGDSEDRHREDLRALGIGAPCTAEEIKAAYRRRALDVHPDKGGSPAEFRDVEAAYRRLSREAQP